MGDLYRHHPVVRACLNKTFRGFLTMVTVRFARRGVCRLLLAHCLAVRFFFFSEEVSSSSDIHVVEFTCETEQQWFCLLRKQRHAPFVKPTNKKGGPTKRTRRPP